MTHKFDPKHAVRLDEPERKKILDPARVLASLNLAAGMHVADVGCGTGYFTLPMAEAVKETGKILAVDISRELLDYAEEKLSAARISNVEFITSEETSIPVPEGAIDAAFVANVLHEVNGQTAFLLEIRRLLKGQGALLVVDWKKEETPIGPPLEDRLSPEQVVGLAELAGYGVQAVSDVGIYHYAVLFKKLT
ncbi:MAG: class I SAM-dependent methyltransferase [Bacillota bacterium]